MSSGGLVTSKTPDNPTSAHNNYNCTLKARPSSQIVVFHRKTPVYRRQDVVGHRTDVTKNWKVFMWIPTMFVRVRIERKPFKFISPRGFGQSVVANNVPN